ncbi:sugar phosphate isomerase/epimerase family protein [Rouxiella badensis]|uniref:sugar phosphate isomerase/epimerase family protein n=1 Tax=Rouxiella badensis TaxID=1646377 RepID=UPI0017886C5F|nr:sugar phosphate isomerase/epimerase [Rouxiella badensis]QOI57003.1 sugar phosphate isomerase/epimerase [Rouxiella badensis subsp. acadiensis]
MKTPENGAEIVIVTAAYGYQAVKDLGGQTPLLKHIAEAGADGVEIRRELFTDGEVNDLKVLGEKIRQHGLFAFYSVPESLFLEDGKVNPSLESFLIEADSLDARKLKIALGAFVPGEDLTPLKVLLQQHAVELVVENDQTKNGVLHPMNAFFFAAESLHLPVAMTFDMANWLWVGQDALEAANTLREHVSYVHVKTAEQRNGKYHAVALDDSDGSWKPVLDALPRHAPRGIEFPLEGDDLTAVTRHYVELLRKEAKEA